MPSLLWWRVYKDSNLAVGGGFPNSFFFFLQNFENFITITKHFIFPLLLYYPDVAVIVFIFFVLIICPSHVHRQTHAHTHAILSECCCHPPRSQVTSLVLNKLSTPKRTFLLYIYIFANLSGCINNLMGYWTHTYPELKFILQMKMCWCVFICREHVYSSGGMRLTCQNKCK